MNSDWHKVAAVFTGVVICILTAISLLFGWLMLGVFTGVFGMCTSASEGWATVFIVLSMFIPVVSLLAGRWTYRSYDKALSEKQRLQNTPDSN